jgi:cytochrome c5
VKYHQTASRHGRGSVFSLVLAVLLSGCGTEDPVAPTSSTTTSTSSGTPQVGPGENLYVNTVHPLLVAEGCAGCHATGSGGAPIYMDNDATASYAKLKAYPNLFQAAPNSQLWQHGAHSGPALSEGGEASVIQWLEAEFPGQPAGGSTGGGSSGGALSLEEQLNEFSKCMSRDEWEDLGMGEFPNIFTIENRSCKACHFNGNGGTFLNEDVDTTFEANTRPPFRNRLIRPKYDEGKFIGLEGNDRMVVKGTITADEDDVLPHDNFVVPQAQRTALLAFQAATLARLNGDGECTTPFR